MIEEKDKMMRMQGAEQEQDRIPASEKGHSSLKNFILCPE
jgi:hypothetical protein